MVEEMLRELLSKGIDNHPASVLAEKDKNDDRIKIEISGSTLDILILPTALVEHITKFIKSKDDETLYKCWTIEVLKTLAKSVSDGEEDSGDED